ncbi:MAG: hypothetical protein LBD76_06595, partial [Prevotellaceae bacterium]|nr:hypothetical protein [Prevotellaceae bacterium]
IEWKDGVLSKAIIKANYNVPCKLRTKTPVKISVDGKEVATSSTEENLLEFNAIARKMYVIK